MNPFTFLRAWQRARSRALRHYEIWDEAQYIPASSWSRFVRDAVRYGSSTLRVQL